MMKRIVLFNAEDQADLRVESQMVNHTKYELQLCNNCADTEIGKVCAEADGVITIYSPIDEQALSEMKRCKVVALQSIGYNNVDLKAATRHHVAIANAPGFCAQEVATHTVALALACNRQVVKLHQRVQKHVWDYSGQPIQRLSGQTFGLIAFGQIPQAMVPMLHGLGLHVIAYGPRTPDTIYEKLGVERVDIDELLRRSDFVSMHMPLNEQTENYMDQEKFCLMKESAYFINTARGGVVDEDALAEAVQTQKIAGAALDVLKDEKTCSSPLIGMPNVIITPHMGFYSEGSAADMRRIAMTQVLQVLEEGRLPEHLVNRDLDHL